MKRAMLALMLWLLAVTVAVAETTSPASLDLTLALGEATTEPVSLTIEAVCIRSYLIEVVASQPDALVTNLSGAQPNGCGGSVSSFQVQIVGAGVAQSFDLQFVDAEFGGVLATIPVTLGPPAPASEIPTLGPAGIAVLACLLAAAALRLGR